MSCLSMVVANWINGSTKCLEPWVDPMAEMAYTAAMNISCMRRFHYLVIPHILRAQGNGDTDLSRGAAECVKLPWE